MKNETRNALQRSSRDVYGDDHTKFTPLMTKFTAARSNKVLLNEHSLRK
jgi:hypothetical protein